MLHLHTETSQRWLLQVDRHLDEILVDHAHCETKAAHTAMNLLVSYIQDVPLCVQMTEIVNEELEHFHAVLAELEKRDIPFRRLRPGSYGRKLNALIRKEEPERAVDRLIVASLIEARSCERFAMLRDHVADRDAGLAAFYGSLFESEARHHTTYLSLAHHFQPEEVVEARLEELAKAEAAVIDEGDALPRMHS